MWLINKWDSDNINFETAFLYALIEEATYMKISGGMSEVLEEYYTHEEILTLIKDIYGIVQEAYFWFKEYINTMTQNAGFKQCKNDPYLLYRVNELRTVIVIVNVNETLSIG